MPPVRIMEENLSSFSDRDFKRRTGIFARSISGQDKDPTALTPPGRSLSPAMRGFFTLAQTQSVLKFFNFSAVGTLRDPLFSRGSAGLHRCAATFEKTVRLSPRVVVFVFADKGGDTNV